MVVAKREVRLLVQQYGRTSMLGNPMVRPKQMLSKLRSLLEADSLQ